MKVLGIAPDVWISSAAVIDDGEIIAAVAEERFNRQKMSSVFPDQSIKYCLEQAGCSLDGIDRVAVAWNPGPHITSASSRFTHHQRWRGEYLVSTPAALLRGSGSPVVEGMEEIIHLADGDTRIVFVNHHMAHAANAFLMSPFESAAIFTADGRGEEETTTLGVGRGLQIEKLQSVDLPHSLGLLYGVITEFLGFRAHVDEWKVMALASYGKTKGNKYYPRVRSLIEFLPNGTYELALSYFSYYLFDNKPKMFTNKLEELLGPARQRDAEFEDRHYAIAQALQQVFEEASTHMLCHLHAVTGESNLTLSGGCIMNSVYNGKILDVTPFDDVFISSCPDDSGVSIGAALYTYNCQLDGKERFVQEHNSWGPEFSDEEIKETLERYKIPYEPLENIEKVAAGMISQGALIGWFQGKMEFGQRALGHRSILGDPRDARTKELVNEAVKYRESFRPFAPSILEELAPDWFKMPLGASVPFMEKVFPVRKEKQALIPAVVHVDGTGRLQTVSKKIDPLYYGLISEFGELTGVPVVLNTSFNLNGEPIVVNPTDAVRTFYSCGLDALIMGNYLVRK